MTWNRRFYTTAICWLIAVLTLPLSFAVTGKEKAWAMFEVAAMYVTPPRQL